MKMARPVKIRTEEMLFAGFGGQGIMFMGKLIAEAGLLGGLQVMWMPSYGAEVRGGTAYSMTKVSEGEIASPIVTSPDILVAMNRPSLLKYQGAVKGGGLIISNKSLAGDVSAAKGIEVVNRPLTEIASKLGEIRAANMVAVGIIAKHSTCIALKNILKALEEVFKDKPELLALNKKAVEMGYKI
jgi:2-oxoglutarate ferredoxin oxidoreductase subunit gamma